MSRNGNAMIWDYFERYQDDRIAECKICQKNISFKTTITNLKQHLKLKHISAFDDFLSRTVSGSTAVRCSSSSQGNNVHGSDDDGGGGSDEHNDSKPNQELVKHSSEIRSYFEKETGGWHRCVVCRATRAGNLSDLVEHLREKHPKLLAEIEQVSDSESDNLDPSENTYTEVIYLEDEINSDIRKSEPTKTYRKIAPKRQKIEVPKQQTRVSDVPVKRQTPEDEELESFLKYISCLLKQVPKDAFGKLQLDIVNLIMNAKLNSNVHSHFVFENIIQNAGNNDNVSMLVTTPLRKEPIFGNSTVTVPASKVILQNKIPVTDTVTGTFDKTLNGEKNDQNDVNDS